jgi:Na+-transporting methylmalonyl-CoA/oxaloacetate decarboxylase gamma subunit
MKRKLLLTAIIVAASASALFAQDRKALRINEVMVENESSIIDDYGERHGWIELFNANFAPLEISSIYLTNDKDDPRKYPVPLGDVNTRIAKRQHVVFFADGQPDKGTFHTNFVLEPGKDNWIGVYDADGITLIDEIVIPASLTADNSYARSVDGAGEWSVRDGGEAYITPSGANVIRDTNSKVEEFARLDSNGFGMTVMAMCIVFSALLCLCLCFYGIGKIGASVSRLNKMRAHGVEKHDVEKGEVVHDSGEEIAAIVMALHDHLNAHDTENTVLTINKVKRAYSPWSSKIYGLREVPGVNHRH